MEDVGDRQLDAPGEGMRVEEANGAGGTAAPRCVCGGPRSAECVQAFVLAQDGSPGDLHRGDGEGAWASAALHGPVEEGSQAGAAVFGVLGEPGVDVELAAGGEGAVPGAKPLQEGRRVLDL